MELQLCAYVPRMDSMILHGALCDWMTSVMFLKVLCPSAGVDNGLLRTDMQYIDELLPSEPLFLSSALPDWNCPRFGIKSATLRRA